jgi:hypothetical protein
LAVQILSDGASDENIEVDFDGYLDVDQLWGDFSMRVGRMPFTLGDGRLISANPWRFQQNVHDAMVVDFEFVETDFTAFFTQAQRGLASLTEDKMLGLYSHYELSQRSVVETYFINRQQDSLNVDEYDFAVRIDAQTENGLNYDAMLILQNGSDAGQDITSNAYTLSLSKQLDFGHGVGVGLAVAQGEGGSPATVRQSYNPVLIDSHKFNGRANIVAFSNLMDFYANYWLNWNERWSMHVDVHSFYRQSNGDGIYTGENASLVSTTSLDREIGRELDFYCQGQINNDFNIDFGLSLFDPQSLAVGDDLQLIAYLHAAYSF